MMRACVCAERCPTTAGEMGTATPANKSVHVNEFPQCQVRGPSDRQHHEYKYKPPAPREIAAERWWGQSTPLARGMGGTFRRLSVKPDQFHLSWVY